MCDFCMATNLLVDVRLLRGHEVHDREALVHGELHQQSARPDLEVVLHAVLDDVVDIRHKLLEAFKLAKTHFSLLDLGGPVKGGHPLSPGLSRAATPGVVVFSP